MLTFTPNSYGARALALLMHFHFRRMQRIQLVLIFGLLGQDPPSAGQQIVGPVPYLRCDAIQLSGDFTMHAAHARL